MSIEVKVPQLPESVTDATLITWHRAVGDAVRRDENLVDLETDKVVLEVPAPSDGVLKEISIADGATVTSGQVLALLEPGEVPAEAPVAAAETPAAEPEATLRHEVGSGGAAAEKTGPAARRLLEEHGLQAAEIKGTGREGRITKGDVLDYIAKDSHAAAGLDFDSPATVASGNGGVSRSEQRVRMTRLRARIGERLVEAQHTAAMLTTFNEVDMTAVKELRARYRDEFQKKHDVKLGFMSFFIKASIEALRRFPLLNASVDDTDIIYHEYFDIGVAVSTDRGLVVPILRNAEARSYAEIEKTIADYGARASSGDLGMEELTGGTFTITNGGVFGSLMSTPILNPPQSGILGMHAIQDRPVVIDGNVEVRPMMYLALTYDHRTVDGREAVQFLVALKELLEDPARLLLQV